MGCGGGVSSIQFYFRLKKINFAKPLSTQEGLYIATESRICASVFYVCSHCNISRIPETNILQSYVNSRGCTQHVLLYNGVLPLESLLSDDRIVSRGNEEERHKTIKGKRGRIESGSRNDKVIFKRVSIIEDNPSLR